MRQILRRLLITAMGCGTMSGAIADEIKLPDIGSPADAVLSMQDEAQIGASIMREFHRRDLLVKDPQITEYINEIGHRVAAQANNGEFNFTFFVVDEPSINAFALPGGYIGVHTGLIEATRNEDELAGVLAHEVAHVTQRHIARAIAASQRQSIATTALMLGGILAGVLSGDSDVTQSAIMVGQGLSAQQQINFTRSNEYEADRIGMSALAAAGFDPRGMASFFEVISRDTRPHESRVPEFLRTHPVSSQRIAETRSRARDYPPVRTEDSINYGVARARLFVERQDRPSEAVEIFEVQSTEYRTDRWQYGLAMAYLRDEQYLKALRILEELSNREPEVIAYHIGLAQTQYELEMAPESLRTFERALELFPRNVPLVIAYANILLRAGQAERAHTLLLDLFNNVTPTPDQVQLIARAADEADENVEAIYYQAEYEFMRGELGRGIYHLQRALAHPEIDEYQRIRFEARIEFVRNYMTEEQLRQLERSRTGIQASHSAQ